MCVKPNATRVPRIVSMNRMSANSFEFFQTLHHPMPTRHCLVNKNYIKILRCLLSNRQTSMKDPLKLFRAEKPRRY